MRLIVNTLIALMLVGILGGLLVQRRAAADAESLQTLAQAEVRRFQQQMHYRAALASGETSIREYPVTVDPDWFAGSVPINPLFTDTHPWVEIASGNHQDRTHPTNRVAHDTSVATFWYNPRFGIVRARVPRQVSDAETLALYNRINDSTLLSLFTER